MIGAPRLQAALGRLRPVIDALPGAFEKPSHGSPTFFVGEDRTHLGSSPRPTSSSSSNPYARTKSPSSAVTYALRDESELQPPEAAP